MGVIEPTMTLKEQIADVLQGEDRAVSPVIGVILMVAITVILAAVIGTFVLDLGQNVGQTGPTASIGISDADDNYKTTGSGEDLFVMEHQGGDDVPLNEINIVVRDTSDNSILFKWSAGSEDTDNSGGDLVLQYNGNTASSQVLTTGDTLVITESTSTSASDNTDHKIIISSTDTDNTIAQATVKLK